MRWEASRTTCRHSWCCPMDAVCPTTGGVRSPSGFLPANHQGTVINAAAPQPITYLRPPAGAKHITPASRADGLALLREMNTTHAQERPGDSRLTARIESYELAARLQLAAPELLDLAGEIEGDSQRSMGSTSRRPPILANAACSRGGWWSEACVSCRCGADTGARRETGTIMAIFPGNSASPPAEWISPPPGCSPI